MIYSDLWRWERKAADLYSKLMKEDSNTRIRILILPVTVHDIYKKLIRDKTRIYTRISYFCRHNGPQIWSDVRHSSTVKIWIICFMSFTFIISFSYIFCSFSIRTWIRTIVYISMFSLIWGYISSKLKKLCICAYSRGGGPYRGDAQDWQNSYVFIRNRCL